MSRTHTLKQIIGTMAMPLLFARIDTHDLAIIELIDLNFHMVRTDKTSVLQRIVGKESPMSSLLITWISTKVKTLKCLEELTVKSMNCKRKWDKIVSRLNHIVVR